MIRWTSKRGRSIFSQAEAGLEDEPGFDASPYPSRPEAWASRV